MSEEYINPEELLHESNPPFESENEPVDGGEEKIFFHGITGLFFFSII